MTYIKSISGPDGDQPAKVEEEEEEEDIPLVSHIAQSHTLHSHIHCTVTYIAQSPLSLSLGVSASSYLFYLAYLVCVTLCKSCWFV